MDCDSRRLVYSIMATSLIGNVGEYSDGDFGEYLERFEQFLAANTITSASRKRAVFLSVCGSKVYSVLRSIFSPDLPAAKTFEELSEAARRHFAPRPAVIVSRYKFNRTTQQAGESVSVFLAELRRIARDCAYGDRLDEQLRDRFVCGLSSGAMLKRLLQEGDTLTLDSAVKIATAMETAAADQQAIGVVPAAAQQGSTVTDSEPLHSVGAGPSRPASHRASGAARRRTRSRQSAAACRAESAVSGGLPGHSGHSGRGRAVDGGRAGGRSPSDRGRGSPAGRCSRCGRRSHQSRDCPHRRATCYGCGQLGHLRNMCTAVHAVQSDGTDTESEDDSQVFRVGQTATTKRVPPYMVTVEVNGRQLEFEIDTGASRTIVSEAVWRTALGRVSLAPGQDSLTTYTGDAVPVRGRLTVQVKCGAQVATLALLVVRGDGPSLLGRDWLAKLRLPWESIFRIATPLSDLQQKYSALFRDDGGACTQTVSLDIDPSVTPKFFKPRPVPLALLPLVDAELDRQIERGILRPVKTSEWAAPVVSVLKSDKSSVRMCGSYDLTVNKASRVEQYPLPRIDELLTKLAGGQKFTRLDLKEAYLLVPLDEESQRYTVINTHRGLMAVTRLVYGISSAPAAFQRMMEQLLAGLPHVAVFLDDVCITGRTDEEHRHNVEAVLQRLLDAGLRLNPSKCRWMTNDVEYLGYRVDRNGVHPTAAKVRAIVEAPQPADARQLKAYLGLLMYYSKFLPNLATVAAPLYRLLKAGQPWRWGAAENAAFARTKQLLVQAPCLAHYDTALPLVLSVDASPYGLGAVLSVIDSSGTERPVGYASRSLAAAEANYSQLDKEGLAVVFAVKKFHQFVCGRHVTIQTDHKPLLGLLSGDKPLPLMVSPRVARWRMALQAYQYKLVYAPSARQTHSDGLSRLPLAVCPVSVPDPGDIVCLLESVDQLISVGQIRRFTNRDPVLARAYQATMNGSWTEPAPEGMEPFYQRRLELSVQHGILLWGTRVVVPTALRESMLSLLHQGHPGMVAMKSKARAHVWWPGMDAAIESTVQNCHACQLTRPQATPVPESPWPYPDAPWERLHIDYAGPVDGHMILVLVDAHSKWISAYPTASPTAEATIEKLRMAFAEHGVPRVIVSDNAAVFTGDALRRFLTCNGVQHVFSPPLHPKSNGQGESAVKVVKNGLKKQKAGSLQTRLTRVLFQYRTTPHSTTGVTPAELLYGRPMATHLTRLRPDSALLDRVRAKQERQTVANNRRSAAARQFEPGDPVYVSAVDQRPWQPAVVVTVSGRQCDVRLPDGRHFRRHVDHLRARSSDSSSVGNGVPVSDSERCLPTSVDHGQMSPGSAGDDVQLGSPPALPRRSSRERVMPARYP